MACPHCKSPDSRKRAGATSVGYARFVCHACGRRFNERTGTLFNDLQYPTDIVLNAVLWRLRYKLSLRDVAELLLVRGFAVTTRRSASGRPASLHSLPTNSARSVAVAGACPGISTKRT